MFEGKEESDSQADMSRPANQVALYVEELLKRHPRFTGKLEVNFKDGKVMDINETRRTKIEEVN